jgi:hypothetical protein
MGNEGSITLQTQTWSRDSHGLFDYEHKKWEIDDVKLEEKWQIIYRSGSHVKLASDYSELKEAKTKTLLKIRKNEEQETIFFSVIGFLMTKNDVHTISSINHYKTFYKHKDLLKDKFKANSFQAYGEQADLDNIGVDKYWRDIWKVARDPKTLHCTKFKIKEKHPYVGEMIQQGDIIKIGRIKFKIKKFLINPKFKVPEKNSSKRKSKSFPADKDKNNRMSVLINQTNKKEIFVRANEEIPPCRFCLDNEMWEETNPLINPWECKGSMGLIHINCMRHWLNTKKSVKEYNGGTCIFYTWKIVSCELCKQPYPHTIHFKDKSVWILEYEEPQNEPFIMLESYPKEGSKNETQKSIYVCKTRNKNNLKMGRGESNDLRVNDISISRKHSEINIKDGQLYIKDVSSKFGTLLLVKSPEDINKSIKEVGVYQIGRSVFLFNNTTQAGQYWCPKLFSKAKAKQQKRVNDSASLNDEDMLVEFEVDKLQKNNESEFYLDDEFYDRLENEFKDKQNLPAIGPTDIQINMSEK